jgi:hypothetical protein
MKRRWVQLGFIKRHRITVFLIEDVFSKPGYSEMNDSRYKHSKFVKTN